MGRILAYVASTFIHTNRRALDNLKERIEWLQEELGQFSKSLSILWPSQGEDYEMGLYRYHFSEDQMVRQHHRQLIPIGSTDLDLYETDSHECPTNCQIE